MIRILVIFLMSINVNLDSKCEEIENCRKIYHQIDSKEDLLVFLNTYENKDCYLTIPYRASAIMQKARYSFFPHRKLKYFKKGRNLLEEFIKKHPNNIEGRYMRVMTQAHIPSFLGYNEDLESDVEYIKTYIKETSLPASYKELILKNIESIEL